MLLCNVEGCNKIRYGHGLCQMHLWRLKNYGSVFYKKPIDKELKCIVSGCDNKGGKRKMCEMHYQRWKKTGNTDVPIRILNDKRYRQIRIPGHPLANPTTGIIYEHRAQLEKSIPFGSRVPCFWCGRPLQWRFEKRVSEDSIVVDHRDHDRHNNTTKNLV